MSSDNAETGTHTIGGQTGGNTGASVNGDVSSNGSNFSGGVYQPSFFERLFGITNKVDPLFSTTKTPPKTQSFREKYPQWHDVTALAANVSGVTQSYFDSLIGAESSGKRYAHNKSGAAGLFQVIPATQKRLGITDPYDVNQQAVGIGKFTKQNYTGLKTALGREPTQKELYLAHQQGLGSSKKNNGAIGLISNPNARAIDVVGTAAVVQNGGNVNMTASQFAAHVEHYFEARGNGSYGPAAAGRGNAGGTGGTAPVQSQATIDNNFWAAMIGGNPTDVEIADYVSSIQAGEIGVDPSETIVPKNTPVPGAPASNVLTGSGSDPVLGGGAFGDILGQVVGGDVTGAVKSFANGIFGNDGLAGGITKTILGTVFPGGIPGVTGGITDLGPEGTPAVGSLVYEYFQRIIVIVLGLIFVAVGLALFRPAQDAVKSVIKVVK